MQATYCVTSPSCIPRLFSKWSVTSSLKNCRSGCDSEIIRVALTPRDHVAGRECPLFLSPMQVTFVLHPVTQGLLHWTRNNAAWLRAAIWQTRAASAKNQH